MSKEKEISYQEAFAELERIVKAMDEESVNVDDLAEKVKRASLLIRICREKLRTTEEDVNQILKEIKA